MPKHRRNFHRKYTKHYLRKNRRNIHPTWLNPQRKRVPLGTIFLQIILGIIVLGAIIFVTNPTMFNYFQEQVTNSYNKAINPEDSQGVLKSIEEFFEVEITSDKTYEIEQGILKYTNQERAEYGLNELTWDDSLGEIARLHSIDMVENDYFSHTNLEGQDPTDRANEYGYSTTKDFGLYYQVGIGENIGMMPTGNIEGGGYVSNNADAIAFAHVESWMDSPGHRANILDSSYTRLGVGVAYDGTYYYATQNFY